jgi:hypothetical protein
MLQVQCNARITKACRPELGVPLAEIGSGELADEWRRAALAKGTFTELA